MTRSSMPGDRFASSMPTLLLSLLALSCAAGEPLSAPLPPSDPPVAPRPPADSDSLLIAPSPVTLGLGDTVRFRAPDSTIGGTPVSGPVEWSATGGSIDASGLYRATVDGLHEVTARRGNRAGKGRVTVTSRTLTSFAIAPDSASLTPGAAITFTASAGWSDGTSTVPDGVTWTASGGAIDGAGRFVAGPNAGTYRVIGGLLSREDTAVVVVRTPPASLSSLTITPAMATVAQGGTQAFSAAATWSDGSTSLPALAWSASGGTVSQGGIYMAPAAAGTYLVVVRAPEHAVADTATVTVPAAVPSSCTVLPGSVTLESGRTQTFAASVLLSNGSTGSSVIAWTATGGSISTAGLYTAGVTAGTFRVTAAVSGTSVTCSASITIAAPPTSGQVLFSETFADGNFASRGWYDNASQPRVAVAPAGLPGSLQWSWVAGATVPTNGGAMRRRFTPTSSLYVSYRVQHSANWVGSARAYHPHEIMVLSDLDGQWAAPTDTWLNAYIESNYQNGLLPAVKFQDNRAIRADAIGSVPAADAESRAVSGCNGRQGPGVFECYAANTSTGWYNSRGFFGSRVAAPADTAWHRVEVYMRLNSVVGGVAQQDGIVRYWWDGQLVFEHTNVLMRSGARSALQLNQFVFGPYIGDGSPVTQSMRIADLMVATGRLP